MPRVRSATPLSWSFLLFSVFIVGAVSSLCLASIQSPLSAMSSGAVSSDGHGARREELTKVVRTVPGATVPLDVEGYPIAPPELELEQVHIYVRHGASQFSSMPGLHSTTPFSNLCPGERTPVRVRMSDPPANIPERWDLCKTARRFRAAVTSNINVTNAMEEVTIRKVVESANGDIEAGEW